MTRTLLVALLLSACAPAFAEDLCLENYRTAEYIMTTRQADAPMPVLINAARTLEEVYVQDIVIEMIISAYQEPSWGNQEAQTRTIKRFANKQYIICLEG